MEKQTEQLFDSDFEGEEYLARIKYKYNEMSISEKKIADYILKEQKNILGFSVHEVSKLIHTSPATIIRFCSKLGYKGFAELKFCMERQDFTGIDEINDIELEDDIPTIKRKILNFNKSIIDDALSNLADSEIDRAINAICCSDNINVYSEGGSGAIGLVLSNVFLHIGLKCNSFNDAYMQVLSASHLNEKDVAFIITHSGKSKNMLDALKVAKESGATTICLTGNSNSEIVEYADIILMTSTKDSLVLSDLPASRMGELCVISLLQVGVMMRDYKKYSKNVAKSKSVIKLKRK